MREPVSVAVIRHLFLSAAVGQHAPDLHQAGTLGIEVDVFAVGRIVGAVVEAFGVGQTALLAAIHRNGVNIELAVA